MVNKEPTKCIENITTYTHRRLQYTALILVLFHDIGQQFSRLILNYLRMAYEKRRNM
jgi:hypothetical protein